MCMNFLIILGHTDFCDQLVHVSLIIHWIQHSYNTAEQNLRKLTMAFMLNDIEEHQQFG